MPANPKELIKPQTLKGFRDYVPATMTVRERLMDTARAVFQSYGFSPIETPALEYSEILLGKGGEEADKQLFRFIDQGGRDVALRFDLTVPLARFVAQHYGELVFPFKRYHIGTVWRAERPQRGRFREFMQCDFDIIGTASNQADIEIALVIQDLFAALGFERFTVRVNNRKILNGLIETLGVAGAQSAILRALDKLEKQGAAAVQAELVKQAGLSEDNAQSVLATVLGLAELRGDNAEVLSRLRDQLASSPVGLEGAEHLAELVAACEANGRGGDVEVDVAIARGLDYYTGTVFETVLDNLPGIGSVCSGGRYDNLAEVYTRHELPGVGASLGLDRLVAAIEELGLLGPDAAQAVLVACFAADHLSDYQRVARSLRTAGIAAELYPEQAKLGKQLKYAERKEMAAAVIAGDDEFARGVWQVKDLAHRSTTEVDETELVAEVRRCLRCPEEKT
jgi:histidyl-tRNA synthetase